MGILFYAVTLTTDTKSTDPSGNPGLGPGGHKLLISWHIQSSFVKLGISTGRLPRRTIGAQQEAALRKSNFETAGTAITCFGLFQNRFYGSGVTRSVFTQKHNRFRQLLIQARKDSGLTQVELAKRLGRPQSFVSKVERGERRLDVVEFLEVAHVIGLDPHVFIRTLSDADGSQGGTARPKNRARGKADNRR